MACQPDGDNNKTTTMKNCTTEHIYPSIWNACSGKSLREWKAEQAPFGVIFSQDPEKPLTPKHLKRPTLKLEFQGKFVAAAIRYPSDRKYKRGIRGKITEFSPASRVRMFDLFHRLKPVKKAVFLTLTYGEDYPDATTAKNQLRAFLERIRRITSCKGSAAVWRMEFQERGAIHFHIIFFGLPYIDKEEIQRWWGEIINVDRPFSRIEFIKSYNGIIYYVSKYIAKVEPVLESGFISPTYLHAYNLKYGEFIGRQWGIFQRQHMPFAERVTMERDYTRWAFDRFRELAAAQFAPIAGYMSQGFRLYVKDAKQWETIARYLFDKPPKTALLARARTDIPLTL